MHFNFWIGRAVGYIFKAKPVQGALRIWDSEKLLEKGGGFHVPIFCSVKERTRPAHGREPILKLMHLIDTSRYITCLVFCYQCSAAGWSCPCMAWRVSAWSMSPGFLHKEAPELLCWKRYVIHTLILFIFNRDHRLWHISISVKAVIWDLLRIMCIWFAVGYFCSKP